MESLPALFVCGLEWQPSLGGDLELLRRHWGERRGRDIVFVIETPSTVDSPPQCVQESQWKGEVALSECEALRSGGWMVSRFR